MECKYLREINCISFLFHPNNTSLFTLVHLKNRLRILQQNLYTGLIINEFLVPLKQGNLQVDNYYLAFNQSQDILILTFFNYMLLFSVSRKKLLMMSETQGKHPYYIQKIVTRGDHIYFTASQQRNIYSIHIQESIKNGSILNYSKFKISAEAQALDLAISDRVLVAICNDKVLRIWSLQNANLLRCAALEGIGMPKCMQFSKNLRYLLIGTFDGYTQAWDGKTLGVQNTNIMTQKLTNLPIQSLSWFHYSGQSQSNRFLIFTEDGNIKLYSFWFDKKDHATYIGKATQLSLLYINKNQIEPNFMIQSHSYSNFIFFNPGILLFMVDLFPLMYYPVIAMEKSSSFTELVPNKKKQLYYQRDMIFMQNMQIKRVKDSIEDCVTLSNDLEYSELKIAKLEMRPLLKYSAPQKSKFMLLYYLSKGMRILTISKLNLNEKNQNLQSYKDKGGSWAMFIGPVDYYQPFILIVQEDKQTVTVISQSGSDPKDIEKYTDQQKRYFNMGAGQIYSKKINIKIQRAYITPFRDSYVVLYQSENLLRFSNNINIDTQLMSYDVYTGVSLRLDYTQIILDVIWTDGGQMGAVICLDKIVFINSDLKIMRSIYISGYVIQGQWLGYTLLITTKKDVQYLDILSKPQQAYCLQNIQKKYLILKVMADRIFGIQKQDKTVEVKARYFNIMQMLISGYLNYSKVCQTPIDQQIIKRIIQCYAPYFIVNEQFIQLLNQRNLANISKYFIQGNEKMYSRPLRAKVLNDSYKIQRFVPQTLWRKNKRHILDLFLSYQEAKDSLDPYQKQKGQKVGDQLKNLLGSISFDSIKNISGNQAQGIMIQNNFGQKSLIQLFYDFNKQGEKVRMEIQPFKAEDTGQWLGHFHNYLESHVYYAEDASEGQKQIVANMIDNNSQEESQGQGQFNDLIIYYRIDDGKGTVIDDLSDFGNQGSIENDQTWTILQEEPMQLQDKWGKKCPPQYSLSTQVINVRKIKTKKMNGLSIQIWIKPMTNDFFLLSIDNTIAISFTGMIPLLQMKNQVILQKNQEQQGLQPIIGSWIHFCCTISQQDQCLNIYYNSILAFKAKIQLQKLLKPSNLALGDNDGNIEFTEFRLWKKTLQVEDIKENMRMPLEIVSEKRKAFKMKIKDRKKKTSNDDGLNPLAFEL